MVAKLRKVLTMVGVAGFILILALNVVGMYEEVRFFVPSLPLSFIWKAFDPIVYSLTK